MYRQSIHKQTLFIMREIVSVHVGQCGNRIGQDFWEVVSDEHGIDQEGIYRGNNYYPQLKRIGVYYNETQDARYLPRAVFTDLEPNILNLIQSDPNSQLFDTSNFVSGVVGTANNYAKGHYVRGPELVDPVLEVIRSEVEKTDSMQGFQVLHSLGGGSGSGFGSLLMENMKDDYGRSIMNNYSIFPSEKVSDVIVEPYNAVLALKHLREDSDVTFCIDNEALLNICSTMLSIPTPQFYDMNHLISSAISGITTCFRFPTDVNTDLRKLSVNMVPYPDLHFCVPAYLPLTATKFSNRNMPRIPVKELSEGVLNASNMFVVHNPKNAKYLSVSAIFRGDMSAAEVEYEMNVIQAENPHHFADWLEDNMKVSVSNLESYEKSDSATFLLNTTSIQDVFERILDKYQVMQQRKAFIHWYLREGMEESEFQIAENALIDLISDYERCSEVV